MADAADMATEIQAEHLARALFRTRAIMSAGVAGECLDCGHMMHRLIGGRCAFCRDGRLPPDDWEPPVIDLPKAREEPPAMPKSIQLPSSAIVAIAAVESRARDLGTSQGEAAADLIVAGSQTIDAENNVRTPLSDFDDAELLSEIRLRLSGQYRDCRCTDDASGNGRAQARAHPGGLRLKLSPSRVTNVAA